MQLGYPSTFVWRQLGARGGSGSGGGGDTIFNGETPILVNNSSNTISMQNSGVDAGTYNNVTVNTKGLVTSATTEDYAQDYTSPDNSIDINNTNYILELPDQSLVADIYDGGDDQSLSLTINEKGIITDVSQSQVSYTDGEGSYKLLSDVTVSEGGRVTDASEGVQGNPSDGTILYWNNTNKQFVGSPLVFDINDTIEPSSNATYNIGNQTRAFNSICLSGDNLIDTNTSNEIEFGAGL
jgi:hypothetical protein